ncbi:MAG: N-6 DNA methylase [Deltaproteobacteria bacterium]|nr:N-6 DNA methylase [Deltaproteobacteria bacterium]
MRTPVSKEIIELVERFDLHRESYHSGRYNETQLRREFIDPFFKALGWDVDNTVGHAEAYKDVIHEDAIKVGGATKAPDYCFRIGGTRKFFVEAKKPSVNIAEEIGPAYQLRRYAWSAKLPLSILTDFEEFVVYDCRIKPDKNDKASTARIMYLNDRDYLPRWEEIAAVFSKEAVLKGSFDKYADTARLKKGTAEVDKAFLSEIEVWRQSLAQNIALRNPKLTQRELNFAVGRTIDRIIFLRICEDRGIEPDVQLMALQNGMNIYQRLIQIYYNADDKYNSGLFHFREEKGRFEPPDDLTLNLSIDDKPLKDIFKSLYYPESPYEFSVLPADILGLVYEQFLGKVIYLTPGHRAKVEEKPEVKKAGGVYYTPTYIVDYIVKNTVGKLLEGKKPGPRGSASNIRILDPACGSGSFLIGAYQYLLDWYRDQYMADDPEKWAKGRNPTLYQVIRGEWRLTTAERKRILLNNIYGVDIDHQAVEVTKLSLLLKVLEGENEQTLSSQLRLFRERALPDLGSNIKCGNSLIGPDFYDGKQAGFFDEDDQYRVNVFDWEKEFPEIFKDGGFDAVIGNPPYLVMRSDKHPDAVTDYLKIYEVSQYKMDLFHLFIQRGIDLIRKDGRMGYIVPNTWLTLKFTDKLRKFILDQSEICEIVVFDHYVFKAADVHTALIFLYKTLPKTNHKIKIKKPSEISTSRELENCEPALVTQRSWANADGYVFETRLGGNAGGLVIKILNNWPRLDEVARASLGCQAYNSLKHTPEQIKKRVFHAATKLANDYLPELAGKDVSRYLITRERGEWIKYGPWLHDYRTMDWLTGPRILIREIAGKKSRHIQACYTEETYCHYKTILNVNPSSSTQLSMKYLLGILNSQLLSFLYPYVSNKIVTKSFPRLSVGDVKKLPVRTINFTDPADKARHDRMVALVEQMLTLNKKLAEANTDHDKTVLQRRIDAMDSQIDRLVYELYDLTEEEIKIVEEKD